VGFIKDILAIEKNRWAVRNKYVSSIGGFHQRKRGKCGCGINRVGLYGLP
jgi:hypothetical protein